MSPFRHDPKRVVRTNKAAASLLDENPTQPGPTRSLSHTFPNPSLMTTIARETG